MHVYVVLLQCLMTRSSFKSEHEILEDSSDNAATTAGSSVAVIESLVDNEDENQELAETADDVYVHQRAFVCLISQNFLKYFILKNGSIAMQDCGISSWANICTPCFKNSYT